MRLALNIKNIPFYNIYNALVFTYRAKYWKIYRFRIWPNFCPGLVAAYSAAYPSILYHSSPLQHTAILSCFSPIHSPHVSHLYNYFLLISVIIFFSHSDTVLPLLWLLPPVPCSIWLSSSVPKEDVGYCTCKNPDMPGSAFAEDTTSDPVPAAGRTLQPRPDTAQLPSASPSPHVWSSEHGVPAPSGASPASPSGHYLRFECLYMDYGHRRRSQSYGGNSSRTALLPSHIPSEKMAESACPCLSGYKTAPATTNDYQDSARRLRFWLKYVQIPE